MYYTTANTDAAPEAAYYSINISKERGHNKYCRIDMVVHLHDGPTSRADPEHWGCVTTTHKYFQAHQWKWVPFLVGVYLRQPETQRHARIRNTGGVTTTHKYFQAHQWRWVPFLVGVYLRQPGTQRHAWIRNTGGVTTTHKYIQAHQWRWVPFLVDVYLRQPGTQRHARIRNTGGVTKTH
ncbi:hypothetical protein EMCRGX_G025527 [Ephydatia muelleri]